MGRRVGRPWHRMGRARRTSDIFVIPGRNINKFVMKTEN